MFQATLTPEEIGEILFFTHFLVIFRTQWCGNPFIGDAKQKPLS